MASKASNKAPLSHYDIVIKDLFVHDRPSLLDTLTGGRGIREIIDVEFKIVLERSADLLLRLDDDAALHVEFQSRNAANMAHRMAIYGFMAHWKYQCPLEQSVVYLGAAAMDMPVTARAGRNTAEYALMDIREMRAEALLASGRPGDIALAMLASGGAERLKEIVEHAKSLPTRARRRTFAQLAALSGLRQLSERIKMEFDTMGIDYEIEENVILREIRDAGVAKGLAEGMERGLEKGLEKGLAKGLAKGLEQGLEKGMEKGIEKGLVKGQANSLRDLLHVRFGGVPRAVEMRIRAASSEELRRWTRQVLTAQSVDEVLR